MTERRTGEDSQSKGVKNKRQRRTATAAEMLESGERAPLRALSVVREKEPLEGKQEKKPATYVYRCGVCTRGKEEIGVRGDIHVSAR